MINGAFLKERWEVIIIGGGAAGAAAALGCVGKRVLMLDVGFSPPPPTLPDKSVYELRQSGEDLFLPLIGSHNEAMRPVSGEEWSPKLKAPGMSFLTTRPPSLPQDVGQGFAAVQSFSKGGLANGWGAGAFRFNEADLRGFPLSLAELTPLYDELSEHIGINGPEHDDTSEYFGSPKGLLPPFELSPIMARFLAQYHRHRECMIQHGVRVGRPPMAVLSRPHRGRAPFQAFGQDFLCAPHEGIYSPLFTIRELEQAGTLAYQPGVIATHYTEDPERVQVTVDALDEPGKQYVFTSERVILAAGALNSARLALASNQDTHTKLPLLDNPVSFVPAIDLTRIGAASAVRSYIGAELILVTPGEREERPLQGSVYGVEGPLRSDLIREFPLTMRGNFAASRFLVPALVMVQLFYPDEPNPHSWLKRAPNGALELARAGRLCSPQEGKVCRVLRRMGYLAAAPLAKRPGSGSSIHYAGTLPMMDSPHTRYHTDRYGKLSGTERIYVADAATFPSLPAKNHTLTLMANALRIARHVRSLATRP